MIDLEDLGDDVAESGYLTVNQVRDRLIAAGFGDSGQTIRRLVDSGHFGAEGVDWYLTERGRYRKIAIEAVDRLIARRRQADPRKGDHVPDAATKPEPSPVVASIVTSERGVLVGRRHDGRPLWTFIAGEIEPGESPADAAVREVKEETGLLVRAAQREIGRRVHPKTGRTMIYLACYPLGRLDVFVGDEDELAEVRWITLDEVGELLPGVYEPVLLHLQRELPDSA
ncbi:NUDIX hydrolase [Micromonospora sp. NBC_01655]|uniref:NUDIX hydrolase n=1 Tax=Micromonospora sp. NBC_01655 TaxID=2975983 RepID=UPI0022598AA0|nr:NUDIX hydrolase [Micromonospora sp. NBC_01655]MCX4470426.1 NUDIX hydrolase [Micromonospora sp. NBC_01655]